jgi:tetratricopeptide (TPR) repeat protein
MNAFVLILLPVLAGQAGLPSRAGTSAVIHAGEEFQKSQYREVLKGLEDATRRKLLVDLNDRFEAELLQGLSHYYLGETSEVRPHFEEMLLINPDFDLDPLTYGEEARKLFETTRAAPELKARLDQRRDEIREAKLREEEIRRIADEAERKRKELAALPEQVPSVERHNALLNFLPFGVPQIEQGRITPGVLLAISQGVTITATVLTYTQVQSYIDTDGKVATDNLARARNWRTGNWVAVGAAVAVYVGGVVDAFVSYRDKTMTTVPREDYLRLKQESVPPGSPTPTPTTPIKPSARLYLAPLPGGASAGIVGHF